MITGDRLQQLSGGEVTAGSRNLLQFDAGLVQAGDRNVTGSGTTASSQIPRSTRDDGRGSRIARRQAEWLAWQAMAALAPYCHQVLTAGELRRKHSQVCRIDLVAPSRTAADIFGERQQGRQRLAAYLLSAAATADGWCTPQAFHTELATGALPAGGLETAFQGFPCRIWPAHRESLGVVLYLATASGEWVIRAARQLRTLGLEVQRGPWGHRVVRRFDGDSPYGTAREIVHCGDEQALFRLLGWEYVRPEDRLDHLAEYLIQPEWQPHAPRANRCPDASCGGVLAATPRNEGGDGVVRCSSCRRDLREALA